jgi:hypothetical protein
VQIAGEEGRIGSYIGAYIGASVFERILGRLTAIQSVESHRSADVRLPFFAASTITGTTLLTIWTPTPGFKFKLKGYDLTALVTTVLAASAPVSFGFWDGSVANGPIAPVTGFQATDESGLLFNVQKEYGDGITSGAADRALVLGPSATISSGVIQAFGVVWGDHVRT